VNGKGLIIMISFLLVVLYCEKKHGTGKELQDFSNQVLIEPPAWVKQGVLYQVFPRVFTNEGTFKALEAKLDDIQSLGVDILWLMPIHPIGKKGRKGTLGSPYSVYDFRKINPDYGTEDDFRSLVRAIHDRGLKVIIGFVPNHGSNDNVLMKEHSDWFMQDETGQFTREIEDWSDVTDFDYENAELRQYMIETMLYWINEFDIDGFRCDVAGMVPYDFWETAIPQLRKVKPDLFLLAEWEDPRILLAGFNSDYGWTEYHLLKDIRKGKKRTVAIIDLIAKKDRRYPRNALPMRFLENHDEERSMAVFGPEAIEAYATLLFTLPGIPLIYAGQEIGEMEKPSLFEKSEIHWNDADTTLRNLYKSLIILRKNYSCFTNGKFIPLQVASFSGSVGAFLREDQETASLIVCNLRNKTARKVIVNMSDSIRRRLVNLQFRSYRNKNKQINLSEIVFNEIAPFTTLVYVAKK